jgi:hypothetical protein
MWMYVCVCPAGASDSTVHFVPTTVAELQAMVAVAIEVGKSSVPVDVHEEEKEEALVPAADIVDPAAYSIQVGTLPRPICTVWGVGVACTVEL